MKTNTKLDELKTIKIKIVVCKTLTFLLLVIIYGRTDTQINDENIRVIEYQELEVENPLIIKKE